MIRRAAIALLILGSTLWAMSPWLVFSVNVTNSLPGTLFLIHKKAPFQKNDLIAYAWHQSQVYAKDSVFIKKVVGMPGDQVKVTGREVWVNDTYIGHALPRITNNTTLLEVTRPGTIMANEYFVAAPHPRSLDSRYALSGNIKHSSVIGKVYAIF